MNPQIQWFATAKNLKNFHEFRDFRKQILYETEHDYATLAHAAGALLIGLAHATANSLDLSPLQSLYAMFDFVKEYRYSSNRCGISIMDYDNFLKPNMDEYFEKSISQDVWERIQAEAQSRLAEIENIKDGEPMPNEDEINHYKNIAEGKVPYGYVVS